MAPSRVHSTAASAEPIRKQLDKILSSAGFVRNERLSRFLCFVVTKQLDGKADELKESVVGIRVFGRAPGFDTRLDSVVRTEAAKLRARLAEYYAGEGAGDPVFIELPKGGYTPVFRQKVAVREVTAIGSEATLPHRPRRGWLVAALAGVAIALSALGLWRLERQRAPVPIAVLPLVNLSQDPANEYFADGLTDEIIRNLSILDGLAVRSQTSSFAFKGKARDVRAAARQLGVDYVLEGSVMRAGQQLRINAQLVRARDDFPLWAAKFDRELTDIFAVQEEISRGIVNSLRLELGRGRRRYETSAEAYDLYLRARALKGTEKSIGFFEEAIAKDPSFAPAYAGLAAIHALQSGIFPFDLADESSKMRVAAEKAIQLDPLLAEAHDALGMTYSRDGQWDQSEKSFRRAIELDPSRWESHAHFAAYLLWPLGRIEEALKQLRVAEKTDPLSPGIHQYWLAYVLLSAGRYDEADGHCQKLPEDGFRSECLGRVRLGQGRIGEAIQILAPSGYQAYLGYAYARAGRREEAEKLAADLLPRPFQQAVIFAGLGDKDRTLEALDRSAVLGPFRIGRALLEPEFALLRGDPRVKVLRKKVGLPE